MSIDFHKIFYNQDKSYDISLIAKIDSITDLGDIFEINLLNDGIDYKGISIVKGEIFPNPKKDDFISIDKIYYRYDDNFILRLFIHAKIINSNNPITLENNTINETLDFKEDNIIKTLKKIFKLNDELLTNIFIIDSVKKNDYSIKCIEDNKIYSLDKNNVSSLNSKDIILINDYNIDDIKIILTPMTIVQKLNDEILFFLLEKRSKIGNDKYLWGKIIEIDEIDKSIILMDKNKNILKYKNDNNKLGQFFLFTKFDIDKEKNLILNKDSFNYFSNQEVYFSNRIKLNSYSVIQFHFLDYKKDNNIYNIIRIKNDNYKIESDKLNIIVENKKIKNYEKCIKTIILLESEDNYFCAKYFDASIIQGFLKKITTFINYKSNNSYYYEYLYYSYKEFDFLKTKKIIINNMETNIEIYDDLGSKNRRQFSILNIPFQNEDKTEVLKEIKSLLICEIFNESPNQSKIYGIFDIKEIMRYIPMLKLENSIFEKYYDIFGNIYESLKMINENEKEMIKFIDDCQVKYNNSKQFLDKLDFCSLKFYEDKISLSQLKVRQGILISFYLNSFINPKKKIEVLNKLKKIAKTIEEKEHIINKEQILRLFMILTRRIIENKANSDLIFFSDLKENTSPYRLAKKFNLEEINNINEYSKLFSGYLQMDSHILSNYNSLINNRSYSLSLEPIFILKSHLISNYEDFFLIESHDNNILAWTEIDLRITIINERTLFKRAQIENSEYILDYIHDDNILKNLAFGISTVFRHEKNSRQKKNLKNAKIISPFYYCDNGIIKKIEFEESNNILTGEDGILIDSLITEKREIIMSLAKDFIYGELLDYRLFIQKDFTELINKINIIIQKNKNYFDIYNDSLLKPENNNQNKMTILDSNKDNSNKEKALEAIKLRQLRIGDQIYSLGLIKDIISAEIENNTYHLLPPIFKDIHEELEKKK